MPRAEQAGRQLALDVPDRLVVRADALRLEQALQQSRRERLPARRREGARRGATRPDRVELHVEDEGPGFPPEFLPRAFERFGRAEQSRSGPGAGLGLPIAEVVARAHGGSAHAANRPGRGADVWLVLPAE